MKKKIYSVLITLGIINFNVFFAFAAEGTWGENVKNWLSREVGFLALGVAIVIMIPLLIKKAWAALAGTIVASGIALFFINNPTALTAIGKILSKIIFGSDVDANV
jgi:VIT1/CCC1 family predicted Fe2+/Mn2+ transporter